MHLEYELREVVPACGRWYDVPMPFQFIHAADIHLDSALRGLARYEGAPAEAIRGATRRALENLVALAIDEAVDFVLIAGDLYDGDWRDHSTGLFFVRQMARLREAGISVALIRGNHDAESNLTKNLRMPDNVHILPADAPGTVRFEDVNVAAHGQSFATPAVTEDLSRNYPPPVAGAFNIGLLHTAVDGREGHDPYAPCSLSALRAFGYDYWALGHIHQREALSADPPIHFSGNLQGRHARETGEKGALLVRVEDNGAVDVAFRCLDVVRWANCCVDLSETEGWSGALERVEEALEHLREEARDRILAARVTVSGRTALNDALLARHEEWTNDVRALANDIGCDQIWIEKTPIETAPLPEAREPVAEGPLAALDQVLREVAVDPGALPELAQLYDELRNALPPGIRRTPEFEALSEAAQGEALAEQARAILHDRLRREAQ